MTSAIIFTVGTISGFILFLCAGGFFMEHIVPHIKPLERWIDSLEICVYDEEEE